MHARPEQTNINGYSANAKVLVTYPILAEGWEDNTQDASSSISSCLGHQRRYTGCRLQCNCQGTVHALAAENERTDCQGNVKLVSHEAKVLYQAVDLRIADIGA